MALHELVRDFAYSDVAAELGIDPSSKHLWADLEKTAVAETDLDRAQLIHDLAWWFTQCDEQRTAKLTAMRAAMKRSLEEAYGPRIWDFAEKANVTLEGLVLPAAKVELTPVRGAESLLEFLMRKRCGMPSPTFAAVFARCWLQRLVIAQLQEVRVSRGQRLLIGMVGNCGHCDQGLRTEELNRRLEQVREAGRKQARLAPSHGNASPISPSLASKLLRFLGESLACAACDRTGLDVSRISGDSRLLAECIRTGIIDPNSGRLDVHKFKQKYGNKYDCKTCRGEIINSEKCRAALATRLPNQSGKTIRDLLEVSDEKGGFRIAPMMALLGEEILCSACSRWVSVSAEVRDGWVWPVTNGRGEVSGWCVVRLGE